MLQWFKTIELMVDKQKNPAQEQSWLINRFLVILGYLNYTRLIYRFLVILEILCNRCKKQTPFSGQKIVEDMG